MPEMNQIHPLLEKFREEVRRIIVGQEEVFQLVLAALLVRGHVLLEGVPGTAKTLLAKTLAQAVGGSFRRIQLTPDLMPSDIVGTQVFDMKSGAFHVQQGPIFSDFVLADEINRAPAKTQSAMLECMAERQVTLEGKRYPLSPVFTVLATQNPLEYEGTYPLPEAQLDRFLFKVFVPCPDLDTERIILQRYDAGFRADEAASTDVSPILTLEGLQAMQEKVKQVQTRPEVLNYVVDVVRLTRDWGQFLVGGGPRATISLLLAAKALAMLDGRDYCNPDDVKRAAFPVLRHRVILRPETEIEGITPDDCLAAILARVDVPR